MPRVPMTTCYACGAVLVGASSCDHLRLQDDGNLYQEGGSHSNELDHNALVEWIDQPDEPPAKRAAKE